MQAEFEAALDHGKPLAFAVGCLMAASREMIQVREGRWVVAKYVLALALMVPVAAGQFEQAISLPPLFAGNPGEGGSVIGMQPNPYLLRSQNSAVPVLILLNLLLSATHLRLGWMLIEGDWPEVIKAGALIGAAMVTLAMFTNILMLGAWSSPALFAALTAEWAAVLLTARWQARPTLES